MVRLKVNTDLSGIHSSITFQFLMVRLKEFEIEYSDYFNEFQFLMVRLKESY